MTYNECAICKYEICDDYILCYECEKLIAKEAKKRITLIKDPITKKWKKIYNL